MGFFSKKSENAMNSFSSITRVESRLLEEEVNFLGLANSYIEAAGPDHVADTMTLLSRIYTIVQAQVVASLQALGKHAEAAQYSGLLERPDFDDQMLWDALTGDPSRIAVHNQVAQLLRSESLKETFVTAIRSGSVRA